MMASARIPIKFLHDAGTNVAGVYIQVHGAAAALGIRFMQRIIMMCPNWRKQQKVIPYLLFLWGLILSVLEPLAFFPCYRFALW